MIYYFSGTGNSRWLAERLAALTNDEAIPLASLIRDKACTVSLSVGSGDRIGLVFPIYAWGAPKIVEEFSAALSIDPSAYAYAVCTCGDEAGRALEKLRRRFPWQAAWSVVMPNNYIPMYDVDEPALAASKVDAARKRLPAIAAAIERREKVFDVQHGSLAGFKTAMVNPFFKAFALGTKPFNADDACTGCGLCEKSCPRGAIRMMDGKPVWIKKHCLQCLACIHRCPVHAIQYGELTQKRGRYCFSETEETH